MSGPAEDSSYGRELADAQRFSVKDARIRQLEADLAAMTAERDDLRQKRADEHDQHQRDYDRARADLAAMTARFEECKRRRKHDRAVSEARDRDHHEEVTRLVGAYGPSERKRAVEAEAELRDLTVEHLGSGPWCGGGAR